MKRSRIYLVLQAVVCIALAALLAASAIGIWLDGSARKAENPMESVYTPEDVAQRFAPIAPLLFAGIGLMIAGLVLGVKDENAEKPVKAAAIPPASGPAKPPKRKTLLQAVLIAAAVALIVAGVFNGSALDVLYKAITICTECVGLG